MGSTASDMVNQLIQQIYDSNGKNLSNPAQIRAWANDYWKAVQKGYGDKAIDFTKGELDYTTPDFKMLASLQTNVWQFAAAKDVTQAKAMAKELLDENGRLRTFNQFKAAVLPITDDHNRWLKTEYNLAVAGSQMASKWVDIEESGAKLLEFDAVVDGRTTDICKPLNGIVKPIDNHFWSIYYPPNHFNCRSTVRARYSGKETVHSDIHYPDIPPMFRTNLAKEGLVFPPKHPYFDGLVKNEAATGLLRNEMRDLAIQKLVNKVIDVPEIGKTTITKAGLRKCASQNLAPEFYNLKNQLLPLADLLLKNTHNIIEEVNKANDNLKVWRAEIKGLKNFKLVIKQELHDGVVKNVLYSIIAHK